MGAWGVGCTGRLVVIIIVDIFAMAETVDPTDELYRMLRKKEAQFLQLALRNARHIPVVTSFNSLSLLRFDC